MFWHRYDARLAEAARRDSVERATDGRCDSPAGLAQSASSYLTTPQVSSVWRPK
jgi:hypothetical protein